MRLCLALLCLCSLFAPSASAQSTWYVSTFGTAPGSGTIQSPYTSIQYAIDQPSTVDGDTLILFSGTYFENINLSGKTLTLTSFFGPGSTTIDGDTAPFT